MKRLKVLSLLMIYAVIMMFTGCGQKEETLKAPIEVAALNGPTGMGMAKMMKDNSKDYHISMYQSPDDIVGKIVSGDIQIACVPSNLAAVLYKKTEKNIYLLGTNTLGTLYLVENGSTVSSMADLKGKTIVASGKGSTPEYVLDELLLGAGIDPEKDVTIKYLANHTDVVTEVVANEGTIALLPQPHVTIATTKNEKVHIALDLNEAWQDQEKTALPMGVIIANKTFVDEHEKAVASFLKNYGASVDFVNEHMEEAAAIIAEEGILASAEIAKTAIPYCHIVYMGAADSKADLEAFYNILKKVNPKAIGGELPDEAFYYSK